MSTYLGYDFEWLYKHQAMHTAREIEQQPQLWRALSFQLLQQQARIQRFVKPLLARRELRIVITGAGTSAFVGEAIAPFLQAWNSCSIESIPTTDIVSNPQQYLDPERPTLLVSCARSGNSPESVAALALVEQVVSESYHLVLTCNPSGHLFQYAETAPNALSLLMPDGSNDQSFAMTSSFTCMLMTALMLFGNDKADSWVEKVEAVAAQTEVKMRQWLPEIKALSTLPYERLIVLGSGGFAGIAQEASLKSLELSAGKVMTLFDSSLGFRHGPKFSICTKALVLQLISNNDYTRQYDVDLLREIRSDGQALNHIAITDKGLQEQDVFSLGGLGLSEAWLCFPFIVFCQILAFEKSLQLGLTPDNPCPTGEVNRVVQGVTIYPFNHERSQ